LPTPTRTAVKAYAAAEWHRGESEAATMDPIEASERNPIELCLSADTGLNA